MRDSEKVEGLPEITGERIFITGGAGFIGTNLVRRLGAENDIVVYDNLFRDGLQHLPADLRSKISFVKGDVTDADAVAEAMAGTTMVVHLAAIAGVDTVLQYPVRTMEVALFGTYNVIKGALRQKNIKRLIDFSTSEVFGQFAFRVQECDATSLGAVGEARWTYAVSKLATEHLALNYYKEQNFPAVSIRPFNIYGPRQIGAGAIKTFIEKAIAGEVLEVHGDGSQIRSWCYIDDIIDGVILCLARPQAVGEAFNIGNPNSTITIYHLAQLVNSIAGSKAGITHIENPNVDVELRIPNIAKARNLLGYSPKFDLMEGIKKTIDWYRKHGNEVNE